MTHQARRYRGVILHVEMHSSHNGLYPRPRDKCEYRLHICNNSPCPLSAMGNTKPQRVIIILTESPTKGSKSSNAVDLPFWYVTQKGQPAKVNSSMSGRYAQPELKHNHGPGPTRAAYATFLKADKKPTSSHTLRLDLRQKRN